MRVIHLEHSSPGLPVLNIEEDEEEIATLKANVTFHRQIVDLVAQSGADGITLNVCV